MSTPAIISGSISAICLVSSVATDIRPCVTEARGSGTALPSGTGALGMHAAGAHVTGTAAAACSDSEPDYWWERPRQCSTNVAAEERDSQQQLLDQQADYELYDGMLMVASGELLHLSRPILYTLALRRWRDLLLESTGRAKFVRLNIRHQAVSGHTCAHHSTAVLWWTSGTPCSRAACVFAGCVKDKGWHGWAAGGANEAGNRGSCLLRLTSSASGQLSLPLLTPLHSHRLMLSQSPSECCQKAVGHCSKYINLSGTCK